MVWKQWNNHTSRDYLNLNLFLICTKVIKPRQSFDFTAWPEIRPPFTIVVNQFWEWHEFSATIRVRCTSFRKSRIRSSAKILWKTYLSIWIVRLESLLIPSSSSVTIWSCYVTTTFDLNLSKAALLNTNRCSPRRSQSRYWSAPLYNICLYHILQSNAFSARSATADLSSFVLFIFLSFDDM